MTQFTLKMRWHLIVHYFLVSVIAVVVYRELQTRSVRTEATGSMTSESLPEMMVARPFN